MLYYPEEYENFNLNYYRLKKLSSEDSSDNIYNVLVLGINRNIINFYRRIFDECGLRIDLFDSDHSAVSGLVSDLDKEDTTYGLLGLKHGRIDLSINQGDEIKYFDYSYTGSFDFKRELDKDLTTLELDENFEKIKTIYIYGESLLESVKEYLEQKYDGLEIKILDPLEKYAGDSSTDSILHFSSAARFAPLFGLALKALEQE
jgi:Tfp pilus assembly PilM family ATPase